MAGCSDDCRAWARDNDGEDASVAVLDGEQLRGFEPDLASVHEFGIFVTADVWNLCGCGSGSRGLKFGSCSQDVACDDIG